MNLIIHGHHVDVTGALRAYVEGKMERIRRHFDNVIEADPTNYSAKLNLELLLRLERPAKARFGTDARGGFGPGGSHGHGVVGGGY